MLERFLSFGTRSLFGGARRGQPALAALGAAISIWGLFKRYGHKEKLIYSRTLADGESLQISQLRGVASVSEEEG